MAIEEVRFSPRLLRQLWLRIGTRNQCECAADGVAIQEFSIEIPDKDADTIHSGTLPPSRRTIICRGTDHPGRSTVDKAVEYILSQPDAN
jgi:hypothetical protein